MTSQLPKNWNKFHKCWGCEVAKSNYCTGHNTDFCRNYSLCVVNCPWAEESLVQFDLMFTLSLIYNFSKCT